MIIGICFLGAAPRSECRPPRPTRGWRRCRVALVSGAAKIGRESLAPRPRRSRGKMGGVPDRRRTDPGGRQAELDHRECGDDSPRPGNAASPAAALEFSQTHAPQFRTSFKKQWQSGQRVRKPPVRPWRPRFPAYVVGTRSGAEDPFVGSPALPSAPERRQQKENASASRRARGWGTVGAAEAATNHHAGRCSLCRLMLRSDAPCPAKRAWMLRELYTM
jgi:hypothetical protein